jgi:hypothetical protein
VFQTLMCNTVMECLTVRDVTVITISFAEVSLVLRKKDTQIARNVEITISVMFIVIVIMRVNVI